PVGELARTREELASRRVDASLSLDRLDEDAGGVVVHELGEGARVVQCGERDAWDERLECRAPRGVSPDGKGAGRPPVEGVLDRDDARLARRLARDLQRRLDRLRARVAEERARACTAEALREQLREARHGLAPVEVRDVPEPVELRMCGREGRR